MMNNRQLPIDVVGINDDEKTLVGESSVDSARFTGWQPDPARVLPSSGGGVLQGPNHTQISNDYLDNYLPKLSASATLVFLAISRKTIGWHKRADRISYRQLYRITGLSHSAVQNAVKELIEADVIGKEVHNGNTYFEIRYEEGVPGTGTGVYRKQVRGVPGTGTTKETLQKKVKETREEGVFEYKDSVGKPDVPFAEIIDHLNLKTNSRYRAGSQDTQKHIRARWREGYRLDDFKTVIDEKAAKWGGDPKMSAYLRPSTLFGAKFEGYLNSARRDKAGGAAGKIEFCPRCGAGLLDGKCRDNCGWEAE